jgi:hypothetical protein
MAVGAITVVGPIVQSNDQRIQRFYFQITITPFNGVYPVGGLPFNSVVAAALLPTSNTGILRAIVQSAAGSGYIYQWIKATGTLMILQVPPSGSLTTAAPLQQIPSDGVSLGGPFEDTILCLVEYLRNA